MLRDADVLPVRVVRTGDAFTSYVDPTADGNSYSTYWATEGGGDVRTKSRGGTSSRRDRAGSWC